MGAWRRGTRVSSVFLASASRASRVGSSSGVATIQNGLRLRRMPSAACAELLSVTLSVFLPERVTVPSELTRYSLTAEKCAEALTDCTSGYCRYRLVMSSRVFFQVAASTWRVTVGSTAATIGGFGKSATGFVLALNCFNATCFLGR